MTKELVVARYKENPDKWLSINQPDLKVTIYNKGDQDDRFVSLPNVGREAGTWLHHIISNYDNLADLTIFAQGDCVPHYNQLIEFAKMVYPPFNPYYMLSEVVYKLDWETHEFDTPATRHEMQARGIEPATVTQNNKTMWENVFKDSMPVPLEAPCGGQFAVTKENIQRLPLSFYVKLNSLIMSRPMGAWEMEPLWNYIFKKPLTDFKDIE